MPKYFIGQDGACLRHVILVDPNDWLRLVELRLMILGALGECPVMWEFDGILEKVKEENSE